MERTIKCDGDESLISRQISHRSFCIRVSVRSIGSLKFMLRAAGCKARYAALNLKHRSTTELVSTWSIRKIMKRKVPRSHFESDIDL